MRCSSATNQTSIMQHSWHRAYLTGWRSEHIKPSKPARRPTALAPASSSLSRPCLQLPPASGAPPALQLPAVLDPHHPATTCWLPAAPSPRCPEPAASSRVAPLQLPPLSLSLSDQHKLRAADPATLERMGWRWRVAARRREYENTTQPAPKINSDYSLTWLPAWLTALTRPSHTRKPRDDAHLRKNMHHGQEI
jgi:hypothetical protein